MSLLSCDDIQIPLTCVEVSSTHLDSFLQLPSFQNTESKDVPSLGPVAAANGVGVGNQGQPIIPYSPGTGPWAAGPNFATSQLSPVKGQFQSSFNFWSSKHMIKSTIGSLTFPLNSTTETYTAPTTYHYGAQVHRGAKWAGSYCNISLVCASH